MKKNFEQDLKHWFSGKADFRFAPPEILAVVYGIHKKMQGTPKKKAGVPLKENTRQKQGSNDITDLNSRGRDASKPLD